MNEKVRIKEKPLHTKTLIPIFCWDEFYGPIYKCPFCNTDNLQDNYNFCPICGKILNKYKYEET